MQPQKQTSIPKADMQPARWAIPKCQAFLAAKKQFGMRIRHKCAWAFLSLRRRWCKIRTFGLLLWAKQQTCWNCGAAYAKTELQCPNCCASNGIYFPITEAVEKRHPESIEHEWHPQDDSFSHEFGTEVILYLKCAKCGTTAELEDAQFDDGY